MKNNKNQAKMRWLNIITDDSGISLQELKQAVIEPVLVKSCLLAHEEMEQLSIQISGFWISALSALL